jgi:Flp pilus assembly pilin Flp
MNEILLSTYARMEAQLYTIGRRLEARAKDEGGLETVEYVALIGVVMILLGAIGVAFKDNGEKVGEEAVKVLVKFLSDLRG